MALLLIPVTVSVTLGRGDTELRRCATEDLAQGKSTARVRRFPGPILRPAIRKLAAIEAAVSLDDLRFPPGNRLEPLKGELAGLYSIRINDQWRVVFRWSNGGADDVRITDYH